MLKEYINHFQTIQLGEKMSKPNLIDFIKSIFDAQSNKRRDIERTSLPNPLIVGGIFTVMFIIAIIFIFVI